MVVAPFLRAAIKKPLKLQSPLATGSYTNLSVNRGVAVCHSTTTVQTTLENLVAYDRLRIRTPNKIDYIENELLEQVHKDHQVRYYAKAFPAPLSDPEADAINQIREMIVTPFSDPKIKKKQLKMKSPLVKGEAIIFSHNKGLAGGHASISVPTSLEALCSYDSEKRRESTGTYFLTDETLEDVSPSHFVKYFAIPFPSPLNDRELLTSTIWTQIDQDTFVLVQCPTIVKTHQSDSTRGTRVRATIYQYLEMKRVGPNLTRMNYYSLMNMNGNVPKFFRQSKF
ncbi:hypothetical protein ScalyP_jg5116 [Parmales sp. scaly parma]|nr:hypothetical protein ScalyP_jg5116 [Parmales sp. scaly parma]